MARFDSSLPATTGSADIVTYLQTLLEVPQRSPIAVVMDNGKVRSIEIEGLDQIMFDAVVLKAKTQFPASL